MRADARIRLWRVIRAVAFAVVLVAGGAVENVQAELITFNFTGTVTWVGADLAGDFTTSDTLSGSYTFDSATSDSFPIDSTYGEYNGALKALNFTVGTYTGTLGAGVNKIIVEDNNGGVKDEYAVFNTFSGPNVAGLPPLYLILDLFDPTQSAFNSDALPTTLPNVSLFAERNFIVSFDDAILSQDPRDLFGTITSLTPAPVPEPTTMFLLGSGLVGLAGYGRKKFFKK